MPSVNTQTKSPSKRGRGRGGRRSSKASQGSRGKPAMTNGATLPAAGAQAHQDETKDVCESSTSAEVSDVVVCYICTEPVKYYCLSTCNHRTCHVCALRLRALYKKLECTFCKEPQSTVIFTSSPDTLFSSYTLDDMRHNDSKLSIYFETTEMMEETLVLLRFNCPDDNCDYTATGWGDLKLHVRATHGRLLCDLCVRLKKVFAHEHTLYPPNVLPLHLPSMLHRSHKHEPKEYVDGGVHPLCEFCRECFFGDDELFVHMREQHEECFICKRNRIRDKYFQNYDSLENHFSQEHFACNNPICRAQKFVVFGSAIDLQAHKVEVHGDEMSTRDRRNARQVQAEFSFEDQLRRNRAPREREPPPERNRSPPRPRFDVGELFNVRPAGEPSSATSAAAQPVSGNRPVPIGSREDIDPAVARRHASFLSRLEAIAPNPTNAIPAARAAIRGYRANESSARDIISTIWNIFDCNLENTANIINGIVDLLDEDEKKSDLLASWNGFKIEQRQRFPELVPTSMGTAYAGIASGRIVSTKNATTRSSRQSSRQIRDRVTQAASSSSPSSRVVPTTDPHSRSETNAPPAVAERFPPLPRTWASLAATSRSWGMQPQSQPSWHTPRLNGTRSTLPVSSAPALSAPREAPPVPSSAAFPRLAPGNSRARPPVGGNQSLRNIMGDPVPRSWAQLAALDAMRGLGAGATDESTSAAIPGLAAGAVDGFAGLETEDEGGKGRKGKGKGKGKQKQTLLTFGSLPA